MKVSITSVATGFPTSWFLPRAIAKRLYLVNAIGEQEVESRMVTFPIGGAELTIDFNELFAELDRD